MTALTIYFKRATTLSILIFLAACKFSWGLKLACTCQNDHGASTSCNDMTKELDREVIVVYEGKSDFREWRWDSLTSVLSTNNTYSQDLMCYAHSRNKKYGIIENFPTYSNVSNQDFQQWIATITQRFNQDLIIDLIAFDMTDLLGSCQLQKSRNASDVIEATNIAFNNLKKSGYVQVLCIVPYKPPCDVTETDADCTKLTMELLQKHCDMVITSPESYITYCDLDCKARATVPETKLTIGVDEYLSRGLSEQKMLIGIPWHGYDYQCQTFIPKDTGQDDICKVRYINDHSRICDFTSPSRRKLTLAEINREYNKEFRNHSWSTLYKSDYFTYTTVKDGHNVTHHQVWFDAIESLEHKYLFAKLMGLRGVVIWTGDDLTNSGPAPPNKNNVEMWGWALHFFYQSSNVPIHDISLAGRMAAVGVGCLVVGAGLGVLVTCVIMRSRGIKRQQPFAADQDDFDAYHDDDNVL